ncbi:hypothetical protein [Acetonema longum]|uniref:Transporter gate domain protein n=1 Tax=Acetonema longum DSM 6540 TaxID=1009370 RepID=F7NKL7_9FIRM|nr:hypothetical protein [Acetonema longum]EGO63425.1 hypothetical protein ALO_13179 [Acetonema longum DSM 6540]
MAGQVTQGMAATDNKGYGLETAIFVAIFSGILWYIQSIMGLSHMLSTIMKTAYGLLQDTAFFVMAICVLAGASGGLLSEFGVVAVLQNMISPIMRPIFGLPGVASLGVITTFLSDNPAILALAQDKKIRKYFKKYEVPALTNIGTGFGMGLIVFTYMVGLGFAKPAAIGVAGAAFGTLVSTRLMLYMTKRHYMKTGKFTAMDQLDDTLETVSEEESAVLHGMKHKQSLFDRFMNAMLDGGKTGVVNGLNVIPGILTVCTAVMILTLGPATGADGNPTYIGGAYEGIALLSKIGEYIYPVTNLLFGFQHGSNIAFPLTSLGAVGAALGTLPQMLTKGYVGPNEIAVFTGIGMCYSGYLSTHVSMMDALGKRDLTGFAIISHTIGGICAGIAAHYMFLIIG